MKAHGTLGEMTMKRSADEQPAGPSAKTQVILCTVGARGQRSCTVLPQGLSTLPL